MLSQLGVDNLDTDQSIFRYVVSSVMTALKNPLTLYLHFNHYNYTSSPKLMRDTFFRSSSLLIFINLGTHPWFRFPHVSYALYQLRVPESILENIFKHSSCL